MNVLVVTRDFPPRVNGGLSSAVGYEVDGLLAAGLNCTVVSFDAWRPCCGMPGSPVCPQIYNFTDRPLRIIRLSTPDELPRATSLAVESKPDVIHLHQSMLLDFAAEVAGDKTPIIKTIHLLQRHMNRNRRIDDTLSSLAQDAAIARCDALVVLSAAEREVLVADYPEAAAKTLLIPPGIPDTATAAAAAWPRTPGLAVNAGRFGDIKGTDTLFQVAQRLVAMDPVFRVAIAGGLPDSPPSERRYMRKWAAATAGREVSRVEFRGWMDSAALGEMFAAASVYMVPSRFETFGLAPAEAMLHSTPVVAFACGGVESLIDDGINGTLVKPGDVDGFVDACATLLSNAALCEKLGRAARATILDRFPVAGHTNAIIEAYNRLLSAI